MEVHKDLGHGQDEVWRQDQPKSFYQISFKLELSRKTVLINRVFHETFNKLGLNLSSLHLSLYLFS